MSKIYYTEGSYKYQLAVDYEHQTRIKPPAHVSHDYFMMDRSGYLIVRRGYAWDGPSGPTIDTHDSLRASLVHDVLYQMIGAGLLPMDFREAADYLLYDILCEDGMPSFRAWAWLRAVRTFGYWPAKKDERPVKCAPRDPVPVTFTSEIKFGRA